MKGWMPALNMSAVAMETVYPWWGVTSEHEPSARRRPWPKYLTADERQRFIAAITHVRKPADQTFVLTIAHTGA